MILTTMTTNAIYPSFDEVATRLIRDDRVKVSDLVRRLHEIAIEVSHGMKTIFVKYCAIHGGFGYSDAYQDWRLQDINDEEQETGRTDDQDVRNTMKRFARDMFSRCPPKLERILMAYHVWDASLVLRIAKERDDRMQKKEDVIRKIKHIQSLIQARVFEDTTSLLTKIRIDFMDIKKQFMVHRDCYFDNFDRSCLREFERTGKLILETIEEGAYDPSMLEMVHHPKVLDLAAFFLQKKRDDKSDRKLGDAESFLDYMLATGNIDWKRQYVLHEDDAKFAEFLSEMMYQTDAEWDALERMDYSSGWFEKDDMRDVHPLEMMGRMFASGRYCRLAIAEVPALSNWKIGVYDGLESVTY